MYVMFGVSGMMTAFLSALGIAGQWGMMQKSGVKGWWALIPCAREYQLARCAGREPEGRITSTLSFVVTIGYLLGRLPLNSILTVVLAVLVITLNGVLLLYRLRVYSGLVEVYGMPRKWLWLWLLTETRWIPALLWGWKKDRQPLWKLEDMQKSIERMVSGEDAAVMETGLTVNMKERSVR